MTETELLVIKARIASDVLSTIVGLDRQAVDDALRNAAIEDAAKAQQEQP